MYSAPDNPHKLICENLRDLETMVADLSGATIGFMDVETTSRSKTEHSKNPYKTCWLAGVAITTIRSFDANAYYVPTGHAPDLFGSSNIPQAAVIDALQRICASWLLWVNQSIKYDMHVLTNCADWMPRCTYEDLLTLAKIEDTDRFIYDLTELSLIYRGKGIKQFENALQIYLNNNEDYGRIPIDVMGTYACEDVIATKEIWQQIDSILPHELDCVRQMERGITKALFDTECAGLRINPQQLAVKQFEVGYELNLKNDNLAERVKFPGFNVNSPAHMNELFVNRLGLPVLKWTNEDDKDKDAVHNPSFGKDALSEYLVHPKAPTDTVKEVIAIRKLSKFYSGFLRPYSQHNIAGMIHSNYNQLVRSGRMACRAPNAQQLDMVAKSLIIPDPGCSFLSVDQSQIEFRTIAHFIQDRRCIKAYNENPDTDFHQWVADLSHIARKPAKTVNFLMGYGGGKEKLILALMKDPELVGSIKAEVDDMLVKGVPYVQCEAYFQKRARAMATSIYERYHMNLPSLKRTSYTACDKAKANGYIRTMYNRRRHLARERAHIAFNSACQGTAADFIKDSIVRLMPLCAGAGVSMPAIVHDEILFHGPSCIVESEAFIRAVLAIMECPEPLYQLSVPVRCSYGYSREHWLAASKVEAKYPLEKSDWLQKRLTV